MKTTIALAAALALTAGTALRPAYAAHAGAPYSHVNKKNDKGNNTGDAEVDRLNAAQLNQGATPAPAQPMTPMGAASGSGKAVGAR